MDRASLDAFLPPPEHVHQSPAPRLVRPPVKSTLPFLAAQNRPQDGSDGIFRVVIIASGSTASANLPALVGALSKDSGLDLQIVATHLALQFFSQDGVDQAIRQSWNLSDDDCHSISNWGVRVWTDQNDWECWDKQGDPVLHLELRRWADLVIVAPCSADFLAKCAAGICDDMALSLLRAVSPSTPVIICPDMSSHAFVHPFTAKHLATMNELGHVVLGPQGTTGTPAPDFRGRMTDWRDVVIAVQDMAALYHMRNAQHTAQREQEELERERERRSRAQSEQVQSEQVITEPPSRGEPVESFIGTPNNVPMEDMVFIREGMGARPTPATAPRTKPGAPPHCPPHFHLFRPIWGEVSYVEGDVPNHPLPVQETDHTVGPSSVDLSLAATPERDPLNDWKKMQQGSSSWERHWWFV